MDPKTLDSSIRVEPWEVGDMLVLHHFHGTFLLSQHEADHLRAQLDKHLAGVPEMPQEQSDAIIAERAAMLAPYLANGAD